MRSRGISVPVVPGILPVQNFKQTKAFAARCGASVPDWLAERFDGLDVVLQQSLAPEPASEGKIAVSLWLGRDPRITLAAPAREVA